MPIYEFYCENCDTIYNFFSKFVNTDKVPCCPHCRTVSLKRQMSIFSTISMREGENNDDMLPIDEAKMGEAMGLLAGEAEKIDEDDPRQAARLMRKLSAATGLKFSAGMEEALGRMEAGEDIDKIDEEMGELLEEEEPFVLNRKVKTKTRRSTPLVDEKIYEL